MNYSGLGRKGVEEFVLHIQARTATGETANIRRIFRIGQLCGTIMNAKQVGIYS